MIHYPYDLSTTLAYINYGLLIIVWIMFIEGIWQSRVTRQMTNELNSTTLATAGVHGYHILSDKIDKKRSRTVTKLKYQLVFAILLLAVSLYRVAEYSGCTKYLHELVAY